ncbi:uncharacterized protein [Argopecten irradians]|uniref:uncharacterized protein isoform X2 n=1 Tax=Argopecten irradians TaxID=31199 RepID=UPI003715DE35
MDITEDQQGKQLHDQGTAEDEEIDENELRITEDLPEGYTASSDMRDSELTADDKAISEMAPMAMQVQKLASSQNRYISSSYENVYDAVPLDPEKNRLSMDASELEIGDRFDTKQSPSHLQSTELASSYEQLYAKEEGKSEEDLVPVAQRSGPIYYEPGDEDQDSDEDEVLDFTTPKHLGQTEGTDSQGS